MIALLWKNRNKTSLTIWVLTLCLMNELYAFKWCELYEFSSSYWSVYKLLHLSPTLSIQLYIAFGDSVFPNKLTETMATLSVTTFTTTTSFLSTLRKPFAFAFNNTKFLKTQTFKTLTPPLKSPLVTTQIRNMIRSRTGMLIPSLCLILTWTN